mgnify:CR=1 FL=1|jgi:hypothetical protein
MHAFQHLYMFPVLSFYWLSSIFHEEMLTVEQARPRPQPLPSRMTLS